MIYAQSPIEPAFVTFPLGKSMVLKKKKNVCGKPIFDLRVK